MPQIARRRTKAQARELYRKNPRRFIDAVLRHRRKAFADPKKLEKYRADQRAYYYRRGKIVAKLRRQKYPMITKATSFSWRYKVKVTPKQFEELWEKQAGRCALTGRKMTKARAEIDHILPRSRGGTHDMANLRFVISEANMLKRDLTDRQVRVLIRDIAKHLKINQK